MRLFQWLLRLYPASFRDEYGAEMQRVFARRRRDAHGLMAVASLWMREIADAVTNAARVHLDILRQDVRGSTRAFRRSPTFFLTAMSVTALGIGATTAAFTLADHVLWRPLAFREPDRLVKIWEGSPDRPSTMRGLQGTNDVSAANYRDWNNMATSFEGMGLYGSAASNLVGRGDPERLTGALVSANLLTVLGVRPAFGRDIEGADDKPGAPCVVLISDAFRRRAFNAGESVLAERIMLDDESCAIVGVLPAGLDFPQRDVAFWRPIRLATDAYDDRGNTYLRVIARLKAGVSRDQASADLARVSARLAEIYPDDNKDIAAVVVLMREEIGAQARTLIYALAWASACVLLIACTSLASLFIARATARAPELAVRSALGAGSERLLRQLMTDTLLIAIAGAALGIGVAIVAIPTIARLAPTALPISAVPAMDVRMLMFAAIATILTALLCGMWPAARASRQASAGALRGGTRTGTSRGTERLRSYLVVAQVAASVALLVCAGLLLRALWRVQAIDPGFDAGQVMTMRLNLPWPKYDKNEARLRLYRRVSEDVAALPDVAGSAFASYLPLTMRGGVWGIFLPGKPQTPGSQAQMALSRFVTPDYFRVMGVPLKSGRHFDARDSLKGEPVAIVSETFGQALWPGQPMIGRRFIVMRTERTIVGVVGEVRVRGLEGRSEPQMYLPGSQQPDNAFIYYTPRDLAVRTNRSLDGDAAGTLSTSIRRIVAAADPSLPISDVRPLASIVSNDTAARAVQANVLRGFAGVACVLAGVGLYGLLAFMVAARTREIGVRLAIGARRRDIIWMVTRRGARLAAIGGGVGLAAGYLAGRSFQVVLAGVDPADALTLSVAALITTVMTLAGSLAPAVRAARTSPLIATRAE